jgi:hypothetical protein
VTAEVLGLVRRGQTDELVARLAPLTLAERRGIVVALKEYVKTPDARHRLRTPALLVAGAGCLSTAAQVAVWLHRREFRFQRGDGALVVRALADRGVAWAPEIIDRVADALPTREEWRLEIEWRFVAEMVVAGGTPTPRGDAFVIGWVIQQGYGPGLTTLERLGSDPFLPDLLPRLFEVDGVGAPLTSLTGGSGSSITAFPAALAILAAEGRVDRAVLLDGCLGRFLRGGTPPQLRGFVQLHAALEPTEAEIEARTLDYARLLPDAPPAVATLALSAPRTLDKAGLLELDTLLEGAAAVLRRPDKTLVRTQLSLLDSVARRRRDRIGDVLATVAHAFGQEDVALQERALAIVEAHASACTPEVRARLAAEAASLSADLPARARSSLGDPGSAASPRVAAVGLPAPAVGPGRRRETVSAIASPAELVAELVALGPSGHAALERVLDATVRLAATDRAGLLDAVAPVMARHEKEIAEYPDLPWIGPRPLDQVLDVVRTVRDQRPGRGLAARARGSDGGRYDHPLERVISRRLAEVGLWVTERPVPFLLSTPTWTTGHIDPHALVDRLAAAEAGGWHPWPMDVTQAILRLPRTIDPDATARAVRLASPEGRLLAEVLAAGGTADPTTRRVVVRRHRDRHESEADKARPDNAVLVAVDGAHPDPVVQKLFRLDPPVPFGFGSVGLWPEVLPSHREVIAALMLDHFECGFRGTFSALVLLAECEGPCGSAMVLAVAYGLTAQHSEDRIAAADALITLLRADELDPSALGAELGALSVGGHVKLSRAVASLNDVAKAGGEAAVASIALAGLPSLLTRPKPPHGTPDLLALASRLVQPGSRTHADTVTHLAPVAARGGSSRLVTEAVRLHRILTVR